ncbi:MAG: zinc-dependent alcohol dehydrogenase family protein [Parachlamydiales bacterium]|nr:zinc-dependent alcohol dehydrogenase family protein [Parachlamydiales bacterium]
MRAYVIKETGSPAVFHEIEAEMPKLKSGHVLVKVAASSVNPLDIKMCKGTSHSTLPMPCIMHSDVSGMIEEIGPDVKLFKKGDLIYGCPGGFGGLPGVLADYIIADERYLARKPQKCSMAEAAAMPLVAIASWMALVDRLNIQPGDKVLVHGGAGGIGHFAIQLAKTLGAYVATTVSNDQKAEIAIKLGADVAINYRQENVEDYVKRLTDGNGFDAVFDTVGGKTLEDSFLATKLHGKVASIMPSGSHGLDVLFAKELTLYGVRMTTPYNTGIGCEHIHEILTNVAKMIDDQRITPLLDRHQFTFQQAAKAHAYWESGQAIGKIALINS